MKGKRRSLVLLSTAGLLALLGANSYSQVKRPPRPSWGDVYKALDTNQNGIVSTDELSDLKAAADLILKICDKDGEVGLSAVDLVEVREIASKADTDNDGVVDRNELDQWLVVWRGRLSQSARDKSKQVAPSRNSFHERQILSKDHGRISLKTVLGTNKNGFDDSDFLNVYRAAKIIMKKFDSNGDKKLSVSELSPISESLRNEDPDRKGVSQKELIHWLERWRKELTSVPKKARRQAPTRSERERRIDDYPCCSTWMEMD